jgi:hypothetical protein
MSAANEFVPLLMLASGQALKMQQVMLYDRDEVVQIAAARAEAMKGLGGVSTGIGFIGSPEWAIGGAAALGLFEGLLSSAVQRKAAESLRMAEQRAEQLRTRGRYFDAVAIAGLDVADPFAWYAQEVSTRLVDVSEMGWEERGKLFRVHKLNSADVIDGKVSIPTRRRFIHDARDFLNVMSDIGPISIRWSYVVAFRPAQSILGARMASK